MADQRKVPTENHNMIVVITFFLMYAVNLSVIYLANMFFPQQVVLGTMSMSSLSALFLSTGVLSGIVTLAMPFFGEIEVRNKMILTPLHWMIGYFFVNFIGLWLVARGADVLGLGISSWMIVLVLAVVLDFIQGGVMSGLGKKLEK